MLAPLPSGRHGLPREYVIRSQRARLLHAAVAVAGADGYAAMTVTAVIRRAAVSRKTFYEQFADREDCFLAAYELVAARALDGMRSVFAQQETWPEQLCAALAWALQALARHPEEARLAFAEVLVAGPRALARRDRVLDELQALLAPGLDAAAGRATVPSSMPRAACGALFELIGRSVRAGDVAALPELLPDLLFCVLAPFLGPAEAARVSRDEAAACAGRPQARV